VAWWYDSHTRGQERSWKHIYLDAQFARFSCSICDMAGL